MGWLTGLLYLMAAGLSTALEPNLPEMTNHTKQRSFKIKERQDVGITSYQSSYYPPIYPPAPYPAPTYGPPGGTELPMGTVMIEFAFDEIVLRCISEEPYEHIVWTRYQCPQQFLFNAEGTHVADGSQVYQDNLYDVHIRGHDGTIISELLIKQPLADNSEGIYQCEAWPHIHSGGGTFNPYQPFTAPKSDVFIIGGNSLLQDCYRFSNTGPQGTRLNNFDKQGTEKKDAQLSRINLSPLKPRRNSTGSKKESNSKQLRYNLKYADNTLYNVNGINVTADFFRPSNNISFDSSNFNNSKVANVQKLRRNLSTLFFERKNNDKLKEIFPELNYRQAKVSVLSDSTNSSATEL